MRVISSSLCALGCALALSPAAAHAADTPLLAGAASADITPPIGTPMFAFTSRSNPYGIGSDPTSFDREMEILGDPDTNLYSKTFQASQGIHMRVRSAAIVFEQNGQRWALAQADIGGLPYDLVQEVATRIKATGIDAAHLILTATHSHSSIGPIWPVSQNGYSAVGGDLFDPRVFDSTAGGISRAIIAAAGHLRPAKVGIGTTQLANASSNREFESYQKNPEAPKDVAAARAASIDPLMTVIRVDGTDGSPIGLWSNFAVHPTSFGASNLLLSGDNAGVAERMVTQRLGGQGKAPVVVWSNGNEGDMAPNGSPDKLGGTDADWNTGDFSNVAIAGQHQADGMVAAWAKAGKDMKAALPIAGRRTFVTFDGTDADGEPVGPVPYLGYGGVVGDDGQCSPLGEVIPGQGLKQPFAGGPGLVPATVPVSLWRIGTLGIAAFPNEITRTMGARIRAAMEVKGQPAGITSTIIAGLANGYDSYTSTPEEYDACTYEGSFTLFGRQQGARWRDVGVSLVSSLVSGGADPAGGVEPPSLGLAIAQQAPKPPTANAGTAVTQPAASVARYARASFTWNGGDPSVEAPQDATLVALQHHEADGSWKTVDTDDDYDNVTRRVANNVYTETQQFGACDALGDYRFHVTGRAAKTAGTVDGYTLDSSVFTLTAAKLTASAVTVAGTAASLQGFYPNPGSGSLAALPRLLTVGSATLSVVSASGKKSTVKAKASATTGLLTAKVPSGATATVAALSDGCGNTL